MRGIQPGIARTARSDMAVVREMLILGRQGTVPCRERAVGMVPRRPRTHERV